MSKAIIALTFILFLAVASCPAQAQENDTLEKIRRTGTIVVGHRESSVPFSYYDYYQNVVGYSQDYSNLIVEAVKKELNMPYLNVEYVPVTSQNRIPLLNEGAYDFECGSTTNNLNRQQEAAFSNTIFIIGTRLLVHKDSGISDFPDLQGKAVAVTAGTTSENLLRVISDAEKLEIEIISAPNNSEAFREVEAGRAAAFFIDDALLAGERTRAARPEDWIIVAPAQSYEAYGCMLRKGDERFKKLVDDAIAQAQTSGEAEKSFNRWFNSPIPPNGTNLSFEMSEAIRTLFQNPNDSPYQ